jgi:hypothetical protein
MTKRNIVHFDLPAKDREAAAKFYNQLFGWEHQVIPEPNSAYILQTGNTSGAYAALGEQVEPDRVLIYVGTDDIAADLKKVKELGGKVVMPEFPIGEWGAMAIFVDPTGNRVALWKDGQG